MYRRVQRSIWLPLLQWVRTILHHLKKTSSNSNIALTASNVMKPDKPSRTALRKGYKSSRLQRRHAATVDVESVPALGHGDLDNIAVANIPGEEFLRQFVANGLLN